jgi:cytochrome c oxidase subunit 2
MALYVTAEDDQHFKNWLSAERREASQPQSDDERRGQEVFMRASCSSCHTIRGTNAGGLIGPDLTHVGSRGLIGAGTLSNTPEHLKSWVADSQGIKPGNKMPPNRIAESDIGPLVVYLESLK